MGEKVILTRDKLASKFTSRLYHCLVLSPQLDCWRRVHHYPKNMHPHWSDQHLLSDVDFFLHLFIWLYSHSSSVSCLSSFRVIFRISWTCSRQKCEVHNYFGVVSTVGMDIYILLSHVLPCQPRHHAQMAWNRTHNIMVSYSSQTTHFCDCLAVVTHKETPKHSLFQLYFKSFVDSFSFCACFRNAQTVS